MKFSHSWLKELVDIKLAPEKLAEFLSLHAFETEVATGQKEFPGIIVAKVTKIEKHPNADRLRVVELSDGKEVYTPVVCGAFNFEVGATVALALPGAQIPHDQHDAEGKSFTLTKATIRGVESQGMICSARELGLGGDGGGIMLLDPKKYTLGETFTTKTDSSEIMYDVSVPANRPDLVSYRGIAWEISALTNAKYKVQNSKSTVQNLPAKLLKIRISDSNLCKKYIGVRYNVTVGPSPKFIQDRLKLSGFRPINNIVDITNYVMLEVGQPLHAFDAAKVFGPINVRKAYFNESVKTLDGIERKLTADTLVVADNKKILAVAGVIGATDSGVDDFTKEIILESANFNSVSVRRAGRSLGLRTDASARFEKSLPQGLTNVASAYAAELLIKYAKARPLEYVESGTKSEKHAVIKLDPESVNNLLGTEVNSTNQKKILVRFGFGVKGSKIFAVTVPFWRPDVRIWQDLAEEIGRFVGLDKIEPELIPLPSSSNMTETLVSVADNVRDLLVNMGFNEIYTYSFVSADDLAKWQIDKKTAIEIANPLSSDQQYLRPNLAINIVKIAEQNANIGKYFEIGNVYYKENYELKEKTCLFMLGFPRTQERTEELIGNFTELANRLGIQFEIDQREEQLADVVISGKPVGYICAMSNVSELEWVGVNLDLEEFIKHKKTVSYESINNFPAVEFDVSILVKEDVRWIEIKKVILTTNQKLISQIKLIESSYKGQDISPDKKSVTFRLVYASPDRTLTKHETSKIHDQILEQLRTRLHAQIRD